MVTPVLEKYVDTKLAVLPRGCKEKKSGIRWDDGCPIVSFQLDEKCMSVNSHPSRYYRELESALKQLKGQHSILVGLSQHRGTRLGQDVRFRQLRAFLSN